MSDSYALVVDQRDSNKPLFKLISPTAFDWCIKVDEVFPSLHFSQYIIRVCDSFEDLNENDELPRDMAKDYLDFILSLEPIFQNTEKTLIIRDKMSLMPTEKWLWYNSFNDIIAIGHEIDKCRIYVIR